MTAEPKQEDDCCGSGEVGIIRFLERRERIESSKESMKVNPRLRKVGKGRPVK